MTTTQIITQTIQLVISLIFLVLSRYFIPWVKNNMDASKVSAALAKVHVATEIATTLVQAAEQTITGQKKGKIKKAEVMKQLKAVNETLKLGISEDILDAIVESAVAEMNALYF